MAFDPQKPYNELPLLPPGVEVDSKAILLKTIAASRALAKLNGSIKRIPNPIILLNSIMLQEAKSSSEIENIVPTNDELFQAIGATATEHFDQNTKEVLHYREALWHGYNTLKHKPILSTSLFIDIVSLIKTDMGVRKTPGTRIANAVGESIYTPPDGERIIREKLDNLDEFLNNQSDGIDPLIKLAIQHYQFEAIHPFYDGNGRTGRIINVLYLVAQGLLDLPILYLSKYIIDNKTDYYKKLKAVTTDNDWESWITYIIEGVEQTSIYTQEKIDRIADLITETSEIIKDKLPRVYTKDLVEAIFSQPYCRIKFIVDAGIAKRGTASEYLSQMEALGILESRKVGRELLFINKKLFNLLKS